MQSNISNLLNEIHQTLESSQISEIKLKNGTILKVSPNFGQLNKKKLLRREKENQNENVQQKCKENHNHHKDGIGVFGQHFKTEYSQLCPDCTQECGIIKKRQNYILYVSKNVTEENISKKMKIKQWSKSQNKSQYNQKKKFLKIMQRHHLISNKVEELFHKDMLNVIMSQYPHQNLN